MGRAIGDMPLKSGVRHNSSPDTGDVKLVRIPVSLRDTCSVALYCTNHMCGNNQYSSYYVQQSLHHNDSGCVINMHGQHHLVNKIIPPNMVTN